MSGKKNIIKGLHSNTTADIRKSFTRDLYVKLFKSKFKCSECEFETDSCRELRYHSFKHKEQVEFRCHLCSHILSRKAHLKRHLAEIHNLKPFKCPRCDFTARDGPTIKKHKRNHEKEPFQCPDCDFHTRYRGSLATHKLIHKKIKPYQCPNCSYRARYPSVMIKHFMCHMKAYKCTECSYSTELKSQLRKHSAQKHRKASKSYLKKLKSLAKEKLVKPSKILNEMVALEMKEGESSNSSI